MKIKQEYIKIRTLFSEVSLPLINQDMSFNNSLIVMSELFNYIACMANENTTPS